MMDTIQQGLALAQEYGALLLPVLPYAAISLVIYYVMNLVIKPIIASKKDDAGYHQSTAWRVARQGYTVYPIIMGYLLSLALPQLTWGYCVVAGVCAQAWYYIFHMVRSKLKEKGFSMPPTSDMSKSMLMPPGTSEALKKNKK